MAPIVNLKAFDIVLTTSYEFKFGVCGHLYEMIDYYWAIKNWTNLNPCILLTDGTTLEEFDRAVEQKYDDLQVAKVVYHPAPRVIIANNLLVVDGSPRLRDADLLVDNVFLFRCSESDFSYYKKKRVFLLQDNEIYDDRPEGVTVIDYKKKILFSKYKQYNNTVTDTAMFYLTDVCRALSQQELNESIAKHGFKNNIVLTNAPQLYDMENVFQVPVNDLWDKFSTYIYTKVPRQIDCSSRFILECMYYGKDVIYDIDYYDRALEVRKKDGLNGTSLTKDDAFLKLLDEQIKHRSD